MLLLFVTTAATAAAVATAAAPVSYTVDVAAPRRVDEMTVCLATGADITCLYQFVDQVFYQDGSAGSTSVVECAGGLYAQVDLDAVEDARFPSKYYNEVDTLMFDRQNHVDASVIGVPKDGPSFDEITYDGTHAQPSAALANATAAQVSFSANAALALFGGAPAEPLDTFVIELKNKQGDDDVPRPSLHVVLKLKIVSRSPPTVSWAPLYAVMNGTDVVASGDFVAVDNLVLARNVTLAAATSGSMCLVTGQPMTCSPLQSCSFDQLRFGAATGGSSPAPLTLSLGNIGNIGGRWTAVPDGVVWEDIKWDRNARVLKPATAFDAATLTHLRGLDEPEMADTASASTGDMFVFVSGEMPLGPYSDVAINATVAASPFASPDCNTISTLLTGVWTQVFELLAGDGAAAVPLSELTLEKIQQRGTALSFSAAMFLALSPAQLAEHDVDNSGSLSLDEFLLANQNGFVKYTEALTAQSQGQEYRRARVANVVDRQVLGKLRVLNETVFEYELLFVCSPDTPAVQETNHFSCWSDAFVDEVATYLGSLSSTPLKYNATCNACVETCIAVDGDDTGSGSSPSSVAQGGAGTPAGAGTPSGASSTPGDAGTPSGNGNNGDGDPLEASGAARCAARMLLVALVALLTAAVTTAA